MNDQRLHYSVLTFVIFMVCLALLSAAPVFGNDGAPQHGQTWPSRTPTSPGPRLTQDPRQTATSQPALTPSRSQETPAIGSTPVPGSATNTPAATVALASPGSESELPVEAGPVELLPAAVIGDCGFPPLILALGPVGVRSGPGIEYETVATLAFQDERPIVARAATAPWWLIQLSSEQQAWVSDLAVTVVGYTGAVPVIAIDENEGAGQSLWEPTPNPLCTPPAQETLAAGIALLAEVVSGVDQDSGAAPAETASPPPVARNSAADERTPGLALLEPEEAAPGASLIWLPLVGATLILAGLIALIVQRRRS